MDTYSILREIADSWVLLLMFVFFVGVAVWAFLPSQGDAREDARNIPFRNESPNPACTKSCSARTCGDVAQSLKVRTDE